VSEDTKIRQLLKDLADEVPMHDTVPASMTRRAKTRIAINSVALGAMVVALGLGAFAGVRALAPEAKSTKLPFSASPSAKVTSATTPAAIPPCTSGQLRAIGSLSGAAGSRVGGISLMNYSDRACTLTGRPVIELFDAGGRRITSGVTFIASPAQWQVNATARPSGWPVVTLQGMNVPRQSAFIRIGWSNWCARGGAPLWRVGIPGSGTVDVINGMDQINPPPCNGPGMPSTINVGPFEPRPA